MNSIAQCGAQEHPSTRHRKNSRNPVIKKEEIIPPNNDGWNYPCPGTAQGVTASNSVVVSGVASRYGDNSNSLINEQLRQQDLKAMQAKAEADQLQQTIENDNTDAKQETSRFASHKKPDGCQTEKNRRSLIQTNVKDESESLQKLRDNAAKNQYVKKLTMNDKKKSFSQRQSSELSESISSKVSKPNLEGASERIADQHEVNGIYYK